MLSSEQILPYISRRAIRHHEADHDHVFMKKKMFKQTLISFNYVDYIRWNIGTPWYMRRNLGIVPLVGFMMHIYTIIK